MKFNKWFERFVIKLVDDFNVEYPSIYAGEFVKENKRFRFIIKFYEQGEKEL